MRDGKGGTNQATVNITVNPVNDAPVAVDDTLSTNQDVAVTGSVLVNDSDLDNDTLLLTPPRFLTLAAVLFC